MVFKKLNRSCVELSWALVVRRVSLVFFAKIEKLTETDSQFPICNFEKIQPHKHLFKFVPKTHWCPFPPKCQFCQQENAFFIKRIFAPGHGTKKQLKFNPLNWFINVCAGVLRDIGRFLMASAMFWKIGPGVSVPTAFALAVTIHGSNPTARAPS